MGEYWGVPETHCVCKQIAILRLPCPSFLYMPSGHIKHYFYPIFSHCVPFIKTLLHWLPCTTTDYNVLSTTTAPSRQTQRASRTWRTRQTESGPKLFVPARKSSPSFRNDEGEAAFACYQIGMRGSFACTHFAILAFRKPHWHLNQSSAVTLLADNASASPALTASL